MIRRFNDWLALRITNGVGTMWCAYAFTALALIGLPAALRPGGVGFVQWFAQTFLQLVLLSVILVGQNIQARRHDEHMDKLDHLHERLDEAGVPRTREEQSGS